jgi:hypothetical protein
MPEKQLSLEELLIEQNKMNLAREKREVVAHEQRQAELKAAADLYQSKLKSKNEREGRSNDKTLRNQKYCPHQKGKDSYKKPPIPEYQLCAHQFPSGEFFIMCTAGCGMKWVQGDTRETLVPTWMRTQSKPKPNHTGFSFEDMWGKLPHDALSRSDVVMAQVGSEAPAAA